MFATLRHHWTVARTALAAERDTAPTTRGRSELAFLPAALEVMETPASPAGRAVALVVSAFAIIALAWSSLAKMDVIATAEGKIIPSGRSKTIQPLESGVIRAINVTDGQKVKRGQILLELDPTGAEADRERLHHDLVNARLEAARLTTLIAGLLSGDPERDWRPPADASEDQTILHRTLLISEWNEYRAKLAALDGEAKRRTAEVATAEAEIARLSSMVPKIRERVEAKRDLVNQSYAPRANFSELEQQLFDTEGQLAVQRRKLDEVKAARESAKSQRLQTEAEFQRDKIARLTEIRAKAATMEQELKKATERNRLQTLTAPVDGVVQQLAVTTEGGVVTPAQQVMVLVPEGAGLEVEVSVQNKDVGFVHAADPAEIKLEPFPFTKFGTIPGTVVHVSLDAVQDEKKGLIYPARIRLDRTTIEADGRAVPLTPGMAATVEIKTGKRRVIDYLLAPLKQYQSESMRER
ncbi:MAG: HlyD family type I secretion periplasmic adaptor subunit [Alphaproteobacteria bacterium]